MSCPAINVTGILCAISNRRHLFSVPGSSPRFINKSAGLTADCIAYDLEDSVTPQKKADARVLIRETLDKPISPNNGERAVRINSVESGLALADLQEVARLLIIQTYTNRAD